MVFRILVICFFSLFLCNVTKAQKKIYLDSKWQKCWRLTASYIGYITPIEGKDLFEIDVKNKSGNVPWAKGTYTTKVPDLTKANGYVTWFYENGSIKSKTFICFNTIFAER